jgi:hypothetical protein
MLAMCVSEAEKPGENRKTRRLGPGCPKFMRMG